MALDELGSAQRRLGRTLERASIGEDRQLAAEVREKGEAFANMLYGTVRMTRIYDLNNETFAKPLAELRALLDWLIAHLGVVHLVTVEDQVYVNDVRIRFGAASQTVQLGPELRRHNVGGVTFHSLIPEPHLLLLLATLGAAPAPGERRAAVVRKLAEKDVSGLELAGVNRYLRAGEEQPRSDWSELLGRAVVMVEETWDNVGAGRLYNPLAIRRLVVEFMAAGIETEGLWAEPPGELELARHAVRVMRLALAIGSGAELPDRALQDLGIAALVHDLGYAQLARPELAGKSSVKEHLGWGATVMLSQRGFHAAKIHRVLGILYHHHNYKDVKDVPSLFGRILRIAEDLDNLARRGGMTPPVALGAMLGAVGSTYDPVLMQVAVNRLGRYPPGTRVQLDDGRVGTAMSLVRSPSQFERPRVLTDDGQLIDLATTSLGRVAHVLDR
jgi:hypothetical protein